MRSICLYFQVHQPYRLRTYRFFDIGANHHYYDDVNNRIILRRVAEKCYLPANKILLDLIREQGDEFRLSFSISGIALEQFKAFAPDVLDSFRKLADTGCVEFLAETHAHSLSSLKSKDEFTAQVSKHRQKIKTLFGQDPLTFRNTELIYSDGIGEMVAGMGFETMLTEGAKHILSWKSPNFMYCNANNPKLKVLLKNFRLSDDIAFRFSQQSWNEWPLTTEKFVGWLNQIDAKQEVVNLFMDYETFGEHQWPETGIFDFLKALPAKVLQESNFTFNTPTELSKQLQPVSAIQVPHPVSWADEERDLTAWLGNDLQDEAFDKLYALEEKVKACNDEQIKTDWYCLQTSDHFYYMCTKWFSDGDVHKYFNPYGSPYEAFINYMNVLSDFEIRLRNCVDGQTKAQKESVKKATGEAEASARKIVKKTGSGRKKVQSKLSATLEKFSFNDFKKLSKSKTREILRTLNMKDLVYAMQKSDRNLREKVVSNLGVKARREFFELEEKTGRLSQADIQKYRRKIVKKIRSSG